MLNPKTFKRQIQTITGLTFLLGPIQMFNDWLLEYLSIEFWLGPVWCWIFRYSTNIEKNIQQIFDKYSTNILQIFDKYSTNMQNKLRQLEVSTQEPPVSWSWAAATSSRDTAATVATVASGSYDIKGLVRFPKHFAHQNRIWTFINREQELKSESFIWSIYICHDNRTWVASCGIVFKGVLILLLGFLLILDLFCIRGIPGLLLLLQNLFLQGVLLSMTPPPSPSPPPSPWELLPPLRCASFGLVLALDTWARLFLFSRAGTKVVLSTALRRSSKWV